MIDNGNHFAGKGCRDRRLHFHGFKYGDRIAGGDGITGLNEGADYERRPAGTKSDPVLALHSVGAGIQFDPESGLGRNDHEPVTSTTAGDTSLESVEFINGDVRDVAATADGVSARSDPVDVEPIATGAVRKLDTVANLGRMSCRDHARRKRRRPPGRGFDPLHKPRPQTQAMRPAWVRGKGPR